MVGGYIYPIKTLSVGENDLVKMYGSYEAVMKRFDEITSTKKPSILSFYVGDAEVAYPVTSRHLTSTGARILAGSYTVVITFTGNTATATVSND